MKTDDSFMLLCVPQELYLKAGEYGKIKSINRYTNIIPTVVFPSYKDSMRTQTAFIRCF